VFLEAGPRGGVRSNLPHRLQDRLVRSELALAFARLHRSVGRGCRIASRTFRP
jgi:hypothetical protein